MRPSPSPAWQLLPGLGPLSAGALAETLDGGQSFRWQRIPPSSPEDSGTPLWRGIWSEHVVHLRHTAEGQVQWLAPAEESTVARDALANYLALDRDFAALADQLPWRSDAHLARCLGQFRGLRILRQPFGETLLGFLCSATKQIVQIKQMLALLASRHGAALAPAAGGGVGRDSAAAPPAAVHRLPTWPELARLPEADLRACQLGFRASYIAGTARFLAAHPGWLEETEHLPYAPAKERLCTLPGVGEKIADCVLLFGAGRLEAFPVDTWILKSLARHYGLAGWKPAQVAHFGRTHFGPLAGYAQQFLFAWERAQPDRT